ncbi:MAG: sulfatase [Candidatus Hydrogenedentota bacterium]
MNLPMRFPNPTTHTLLMLFAVASAFVAAAAPRHFVAHHNTTPPPGAAEHALPLADVAGLPGTHFENDVLTVSSEQGFGFNLAINARDFNVLHVRMRAAASGRCRVTWTSDVETRFEKNTGIEAPVLRGEDFQELSIRLDEHPGWTGSVQKLGFVPLDTEGVPVEIAALVLDWTPHPDEPLRHTIAYDNRRVTREVVRGTPHPWTVTLPPRSRLNLYAAVHERGWTEYTSDGLAVAVRARDADGNRLIEKRLTLKPRENPDHRGWQRVTLNLSEWAEQEAVIEFDVDHLETAEGDFALWGNPVIFSAPEEDSEEVQGTPVFLISLDTVRADHLSVYGYERDTTPALAAWAGGEAVVFENAIVEDAWTLPAHMSMLTGLYPKNHSVTRQRDLSENVRTMPERLRHAGYLTAGFTSISWWLEPERGFEQGFGVYETPNPYRHGFKTNARACAWLDNHPSQRVFVFLHNYDAHSKSHTQGFTLPYQADMPEYRVFSKDFDPPPELARPGLGPLPASEFLIAANKQQITVTGEERDYMVALYDDTLRMIDAELAAFFADLKRRNLYDDALIILTADHGEAFGEHDMYMHEQAYEHCSRVPLMIKFPGGRFAGTRFNPPVQTVDFYPTMLDVLGLPVTDAPSDGQSLLALLEERAEPRTIAYTRRHDVNAVRTHHWKYLHDVRRDTHELYHLGEDPAEQHNRYKKAPKALEPLVREMHTFYNLDTSGWHVRLHAGAQAMNIAVQLQTAGAFENARRLADNTPLPDNAPPDNVIAVNIGLDPHEVTEWVFQTTPADATIGVVALVEEGGELVSNLAEAPSRQIMQKRTPDTAAREKPPAQPPENTPAFYVWRQAEIPKGEQARPLTEEEAAELEALGYIE